LPRIEVLRVRVIDNTGRPVAGARVESGQSEHPDRQWWQFWPKDRTRTDAHGCITLTPDAPGPLWIDARAEDGREGTVVSSAGAEKDGSGAILVTVRDGTPLDVTVKSARGELLPGLR